jgi:Zn-dependent protease
MARQILSNRRSGFHLMTLFGIDIRLDASVVIIFTLIVYSLGAAVFPGWHADWSDLTIWSTSFSAGILFFSSLLAHELAHSLVARHYGIKVPRITLFLFGGMAEIESEARTPAAEFSIAIAGPLMSFALSFAFIMAAVASVGSAALERIADNPESGLASLTPFASACLWLGSVNLMLAIFNLVPGFPLDGGRVFRALVWRLTGDRFLATRLAATAGKWFGWSIMGIGLWNLLVLRSTGGLWLLLIGWFLSHLATASYTQTLTERLLEPLTVGDLMRTKFDCVPVSMSVAEFADRCLLRSNQALWPVVDAGRTLGTVTLDDVVSVPAANRNRVAVNEIMSPLSAGPALSDADTAIEASAVLLNAGDRPLPVVRGGNVVGLLRGSDILRWMMLHSEAGPREDWKQRVGR